MMVPIQVIRWYRMQCYDGTDSCAIVVPFRRYCQIKPKKQTEKQAEEIFEMSNEAPSVTKAIEDFVQLRNMQMKNIDDRCSDLDDLSMQIIGTYMKRFDDAIDGLKVKYL